MTLGTLLRSGLRSLAELIVATDALGMKRIRALHDVCIFKFGSIVVAVHAEFREPVVFRHRGVTYTAGNRLDLLVSVRVMAVRTSQPISLDGGVGLVVEKNLAGIGLINQPDRLFMRLFRKGRVTYDGNDQQLYRHSTHDHSVPLRNHRRKSLSRVYLIGKVHTDRKKTKKIDYHKDIALSSVLLGADEMLENNGKIHYWNACPKTTVSKRKEYNRC
jgi:hypothetical protein